MDSEVSTRDAELGAEVVWAGLSSSAQAQCWNLPFKNSPDGG